MSYQLHVSAALSPVKNSKVSTGRVSEPVWMRWCREKSMPVPRI
jgi:hypothetical protein